VLLAHTPIPQINENSRQAYPIALLEEDRLFGSEKLTVNVMKREAKLSFVCHSAVFAFQWLLVFLSLSYRSSNAFVSTTPLLAASYRYDYETTLPIQCDFPLTRIMAVTKTTTDDEDQQTTPLITRQHFSTSSLSTTCSSSPDTSKYNSDNKAMAFLRKIGRVGASTVDFTHAIGVDEGSSTKTAGKWGNLKKCRASFQTCTDSGTIDDMSEEFPVTSSGTQWSGITDRVMGGTSSGTLSRENFHGRNCNVLRANVRMENDGGFVQMATDLAMDPTASNTVNASKYKGIELEILFEGAVEEDRFNVQ
jgi:hypothetical protein